jgi:hypothetical protein
LIVNNLARPQFKRLPARFQTATASFPKKRDQAPHLLVFLRNQSLLKPAESSIDSLHRLPCFLTGSAGRSTSIDIEPVTTFSAETNWIVIATGWLVGMTLVSNRSNRRERLLLIIFVVSVVRPRDLTALLIPE